MRTKSRTLYETGLLAGALRLLLGGAFLLACASSSHAALVYGNLHAAEDFTGYDVEDDLLVNGVNLHGTGTGLGTGFSGTWSATGDWKTDINVNRAETAKVPSSDIGGSGGPVLRAIDNTALSQNAHREFASAITQPTSGLQTEFWLVFNTYNRSVANPGFIGLADAAGNVLVEAGFTGYSSNNAHFPPFTNTDQEKFGIKAFNDSNAAIAATTSSTFDTQDTWHNVVLRGLWADDGSVDLWLWLNPDTSDDLTTFDVSLANAFIGDDLTRINVVQGREFHWVAFDDIKVYHNVIPEPAHVGLGVGLLACGFAVCYRRRRK